ncbi:hypothetical protein BDZ89DRAFT_889992, partial [Hymenopellis radicata]
RRGTCILNQLRSGHVGLNRHLHRIGAAPSPMCESCLVPETIPHLLLLCPRYAEQRRHLRDTVRHSQFNVRGLLGHRSKHIAKVIKFVVATGRL